MSEEAGVVAGGEVAPAAPAEVAIANDTPLSVRGAVTAYAERMKREETNSSAGAANPAATETKSAVEAGAAPQTEATGETQEADPAEKPPLKLPRSWASEQADHWAKLDPVTQEFLLEQDRKASEAVRKSQNEVAEQRKAAQAELERAAKAQQEYEAKLPALMEALHNSSPFADIRTMADVERMAAEDPFRKIQWDTYQQKMQATAYELQQAEQRKTEESKSQWAKFQSEENAKVLELHPELKDPEKSKQFQTAAVELFRSAGFADSDLNAIANGEKFSPFHAGLQDIIMKAVKYDQLQKAPPKAVPKPVPQVQRPGVAPPKGGTIDASVQEASRRFTQNPNVRNAAALYAAKQAAQR
jgi:hypothetical protein